jgi:phospholipid/cholesterol/gamma-HCH transport system ATP-binding protein
MSPPPAPQPMIDVQDVWKSFAGFGVLKGINLRMMEGTTTVVLGGSGSGKTVLMKHIMGLFKPDRGQVFVDGENVSTMGRRELSVFRQRMGMVFQSSALFDSMTVGENVGLALVEHHRLPKPEVRRRVADRLEWVGLKGVEAMKPGSLSGGMRKRVGLARAIAMDPQYILYDEPTTGLDPITADAIDQLIRSLQKRLGVTSIVVTHDMTSAYKVADRMVMLHDGKIVFSGTPQETRTTANAFVHQFVEGSSTGPIRAL